MESLRNICNPSATGYAINHVVDHELTIEYDLMQMTQMQQLQKKC